MADFDKLKKEIDKLEEFRQNTEAIEEQTAVIINIQSKVLPDIAQQVKEITDCIREGFNTNQLRKQASESLNHVLRESDYSVMHKNLKATSEQLQSMITNLDTTVKSTYNNVDRWKDLYNNNNTQGTWKMWLAIFMAGVFVGFGGATYFAHKVVDAVVSYSYK